MFYKELFSKKKLELTFACDTFLESLNLPTISNEEKLFCEETININDLKESLFSMENNKSPGNDGLTRELYVTFWEEVKILFVESFMFF